MHEFIRRWRRNTDIQLFLTMTLMAAVSCIGAAKRAADASDLWCFFSCAFGLCSVLHFARFVQSVRQTKSD